MSLGHIVLEAYCLGGISSWGISSWRQIVLEAFRLGAYRLGAFRLGACRLGACRLTTAPLLLMAIFHLGAIFDASEGKGLTFIATFPWLECLILM